MWREPTRTDLLGVLSSPELSAYESAAVGAAQDPVLDVISTVTQQCRGYIADNPKNALAEGETLPERVILSALHIMRVELLTRLDLEVSDPRARAKADAIRFFERVSDGRVAIEQPTGATEESGSGSRTETLSSRTRQATRDSLKGL